MHSQIALVLSILLSTGCMAAHTAALSVLPPLAPSAGIASDRVAASREAGGVVATGDKLTIEADVNLQVENVEETAVAVRATVRELGGRITNDEVLREVNIASFVLRLPPARLDAFFEKLETLGEIKHRRIKSTDVTKLYVDTQLQLDNLLQALARYQEILKAANKVEEMLAVEQQLTRVRIDIERLKGELAFLTDRVDLATVTVSISPVDKTPVFAPQAKFHPGVSAVYLAYLRPQAKTEGYLGPGFTLQLARFAHFDFAVLRHVRASGFPPDAVIAGMGGEVYSDFLGRGKRTFINPFFGYSFGWARIDSVDFVAAGATAGVELVKSDYVLVDFAVKTQALANRFDLHMAVQPQLTVNVAF
jgi:hypothetical protein